MRIYTDALVAWFPVTWFYDLLAFLLIKKLFPFNAVAAVTPVAGSRAPEVPGNSLKEQPSGVPSMVIRNCTSKAAVLVLPILEHNLQWVLQSLVHVLLAHFMVKLLFWGAATTNTNRVGKAVNLTNQ